MNWHPVRKSLLALRGRPLSRRSVVGLLGWSAAGAATLVGTGLIILWAMSVGNMDFMNIPAGSTELQLGSADGVLMVGVFDSGGLRIGWGRRKNAVTLYSVHPDSDSSFHGFAFAGNLQGWALGVPHLAVAAFVMIVPAWWLLVMRNRNEIEIRREHGLCRECGYDLRESPQHCPECGKPVGHGLRRDEQRRAVGPG